MVATLTSHTTGDACNVQHSLRCGRLAGINVRYDADVSHTLGRCCRGGEPPATWPWDSNSAWEQT